MNSLTIFVLKALRKMYAYLFLQNKAEMLECIHDADMASKMIYDRLKSPDPCMIARFGSTEFNAMINYLGVHSTLGKNIWRFIQGNEPAWWWNKVGLEEMQNCSGFFPPTVDNIERFCELMIQNVPLVDVLGSWIPEERYFKNELSHAQLVQLELLNPFFSDMPWTIALEGKKILVVHPFSFSIEEQYKKRALLFEDKRILPAFELKTIRAIQSLGGENRYSFSDWFEALDYMKNEIDKTNYDICLIGCGAYGFPLAAHVKRSGKKAVHLGGSLQMIFGIRGKRWENPNYHPQYNYAKLMNEHWVKPREEEKPKNAHQVENSCYW